MMSTLRGLGSAVGEYVTSFGNMNHIASTIILGFLLSAESMSPWLQSAV